ncbi:MAG: hypothetical protein A7315_13255 [Candidatus Altiarchaeales archaeon WOR_SM1_79]|nr:MAG: hypothetical protein A7315_13255 [Candidatus Altiarchaeales archaeon WOR_SM1_79]
MMRGEVSFTDNVLKAFKKINKEIEDGAVEHDIRPRFVKYFIEPVLGYSGSDYRYEKNRTDITIFDENNFAVIKIETKRPGESIDKIQHKTQAFGYREETTRFIGLTNFLQFKLWEIKKTPELKINLDFSGILKDRKSIEQLSGDEKAQMLFFNNLTKENIFDPGKYTEFDETYARIDITKDPGFRKLLDRLNFITNNLLFGYTLKAFGEYKEGYAKYKNELKGLDAVPKDEKNRYYLAKYRQKIENEYSKYKTFSGYELWKEYSGKGHLPDDDVMEVFCKESIYVLLNKLLFIRICEDKNFLEKSISNGGIEDLRKMLKRFNLKEDTTNRELLEFAFKSAGNLYAHLYETGILDWFRTGDGELNELLNRILWILNQFNFAHVDRDILGNLYEKYLPGEERKKLGEFYTPTEVIDYILTSVGYTYSYDLETKDLLDPACGSGGFLVRATRRLISRYLMKFGKTDKGELRNPRNWKEIVSRLSPDEAKNILDAIHKHIHGLDINPFACHIAEMNMLFQIIDIYQKTREKYTDYTLDRFKIYQTDSLELPRQKTINDFGNHLKFLEEREEIDKIKNKKFDFVVGNPPYVRVQMLDKMTKENLIQTYSSAVGNFDLYVVFIERGFTWLKNKGMFGYIISNKFMQSAYGKGIRKFILQNCTISRLIDFGDAGVFKDVTNYPLIFIGRNESSKTSRFTVIRALSPKENLLDEIWQNFYKKSYKSNYLEIFEIKQNKLAEDAWMFSNPMTLELCNKIEQVTNNFHLRDFARPHRCLYTGLNEAFIVDENTIKQERLEDKLIKKVVGGKDIKKWKINWGGKFIIYPYQKINGKLKPVSLNEYPNIKRHLEQFKEKLMTRWFIKKLKKEHGDAKWFEYADPRSFEQFESTKIITPDISTNNRFALDYENSYSLNTSYVIDLDNFSHDPKYLLGLLNSSPLEFFFKQISPFISGGYYRYISQYLEKLPIKLPKTPEEKKKANQITKKVNEILELHKSEILNIDEILEGKETEKLCNLPQVTFSIKDDAKFVEVKPEGDKIYINSCDFIEIKDNKILDFVKVYLNSGEEKFAKSKDVRSRIINLPVPKSDEVLKEIIKKGGVEHSQIKEKINTLEQEIDELVYGIYELGEDDVKIIKEFFDSKKQ